MKKKTSPNFLIFALLGAAALGGVAYFRRDELPAFGAPDMGSGGASGGDMSNGATTDGYTPAPFGVDASKYYPSMWQKYAAQYGGGTVVTAGGGGTRTPTLGTDPTPPATFGVGVGTRARYGTP